MEPTFTHFRVAARAASQGWTHGEWRDERGYICALQAVLDAIGIPEDAADVPWPFLVELDATLMRTGTYCTTAGELAHRNNVMLDRDAGHLEELIWKWNDAPGRTQAEVVAVLAATADRLEGKQRLWLRDLVARAIRPTASWRGFDESELELDLEEAVAA